MKKRRFNHVARDTMEHRRRLYRGRHFLWKETMPENLRPTASKRMSRTQKWKTI